MNCLLSMMVLKIGHLVMRGFPEILFVDTQLLNERQASVQGLYYTPVTKNKGINSHSSEMVDHIHRKLEGKLKGHLCSASAQDEGLTIKNLNISL